MRVSRRGRSRDGCEEVAILITASMSSFVGVDRVGEGWSGDDCCGDGCGRVSCGMDGEMRRRTEARRGEPMPGRGGGRPRQEGMSTTEERRRKRGKVRSCTRVLHSDKNRVHTPRHFYIRRHFPFIAGCLITPACSSGGTDDAAQSNSGTGLPAHHRSPTTHTPAPPRASSPWPCGAMALGT